MLSVCDVVLSIGVGGARRDRTDDLMLAKHALSQLSYAPVPETNAQRSKRLADDIDVSRSLSVEARKYGGPGKT